jgi:hypothetical protein
MIGPIRWQISDENGNMVILLKYPNRNGKKRNQKEHKTRWMQPKNTAKSDTLRKKPL